MKKIVVLTMLLMGFTGLAQADPILDDPKSALDKFKAVVDTLDPSASAFYNMADDDWSDSYTISLITLKTKGFKPLTLRAGYAGFAPGFGNTALLGFQVDLKELTGRILPQKINLIKAVDSIGKYAKIGFYGGRNFTDHEFSYGPSFGAEIKF